MSDYNNEALMPGLTGPYQEKGLGMVRPPTQREILTNKKKELEERLFRVNNALAKLDKHPEFEEVMDAVLKANY